MEVDEKGSFLEDVMYLRTMFEKRSSKGANRNRQAPIKPGGYQRVMYAQAATRCNPREQVKA